VTVRDTNEEALAGLLVFSSESDGALVDEVFTDGAGNAELFVPAQGFVTVAREYQRTDWRQYSTSTIRELRSFEVSGLPQPSLLVRSPAEETLPSQNDAMTLVLDVQTVVGAVSYQLQLSCTEAVELQPGMSQLSSFRGCPGQDSFDAVLVARDAQGVMLAYGWSTGLSFVSGATDTLAIPTDEPIVSVPFVLEYPQMLGVGDDVQMVVGSRLEMQPASQAPAAYSGLVFSSLERPLSSAQGPSGGLGVAATVPGLFCEDLATTGNAFAGGRGHSRRSCQALVPAEIYWDPNRLAWLSTVSIANGKIEMTLSGQPDGTSELGDGLLIEVDLTPENGPDTFWYTAVAPTATSHDPLQVPLDLGIDWGLLYYEYTRIRHMDLMSTGSFSETIAATPHAELGRTVGVDERFVVLN
jgi:hypothetical protein